MTRQSTAKRLVYSDSNALSAIGRALHEIKAEDGLTWADVGKVLGVSDDMASNYANERSAMSITTFGRGKKEWNGRFTRYFDTLCEDSRPGKHDDHRALTAVLDAASRLSHALEDGEITPSEVKDHRKEFEAAYDALGAQLGKLRAVA